jgi:uncharacterized protein (DUF4213/DUF364 family)
MKILDQTYHLLKNKYSYPFEEVVIEDICIGAFLVAIKLSDGSIGVASSSYNSNKNNGHGKRNFGDFSPLNIIGKSVDILFESENISSTYTCIRNAILNAISSRLIEKSKYKIIENADPINYLDLSIHKKITVVGAFQSYIKKLALTSHDLKVLELNKNALIGNQKKYFVPASQYQSVIPQSDIVIITGLSLVNDTIDDLLSCISPASQVIITGPSSSLIPDVLFDNKVDIIGATRINKPELLFPLVSQGAMGYHLFKYCAQKICIFND